MRVTRAAIELLATLFVGALVLAGPFVYAGYRLNAAVRVPKARAAEIERADCEQLRGVHLDGSGLGIMFWGPTAERAAREQQLINARGRELHCRPLIEPRLSTGGSD